jgi:4'-phosphopantetheinyl transferase EntD
MLTVHAGPTDQRAIATVDPALERALDSLALPGLLIGHRLIAAGDELALLDEEAQSIASPAVAVRRASAAARIVARQLLAQLGFAASPLPKDQAGVPIWPQGIIGSLAHDDRVAVAAVARRSAFKAVGIDVEPAKPLPPELLDLVATPQERRSIGDDPGRGRLLFAAKEAVYKAVYPLDRVFLEYHDIEVDLASRKAVVRNGRVLALRYCMSSHVVVLALP